MVSRWRTKVARAIRKRLVWRKILLMRHRVLIMMVMMILLQACRVYRRGQAVRVMVVVRVTETFTERRLMQRRRLEWLMRAADG